MQLVGSVVSSSMNPCNPDTGRAEDMEEEVNERDTSVDAAIQIINTDICTKLQGLEPTKQCELDTLIW